MIQDFVPTMDSVEAFPMYRANPSRDHFLFPAIHDVDESHSDDSDQDSKQGN